MLNERKVDRLAKVGSDEMTLRISELYQKANKRSTLKRIDEEMEYFGWMYHNQIMLALSQL